MTICTNCNGEGIVGSGDKPWLRIGHLSTCTACKGTGKSDESAAETPAETSPAAETPIASEVVVDNSDEPKGIVDRVVDAILG